MLGDGGVRPPVVLGPMRVRLAGIVRGDASEAASVNAPTVAEATAALARTARVHGADGVVKVSSDLRRIAIACGPLSAQTMVEVQAWGTAVKRAEGE
jgi:uncharacterized protein YbjQ (UPF0145 family)